jgi:hypothetical protein
MSADRDRYHTKAARAAMLTTKTTAFLGMRLTTMPFSGGAKAPSAAMAG